MELVTSRAYGPADPRILLSSYINEHGVKETFPLNSFLLEHLLRNELLPVNVYTSDTNTPNTFFSEFRSDQEQTALVTTAQPLTALSTKSMYFYEYAVWVSLLLGSTGTSYTKHSSSLQLYNPLVNVRWVLVIPALQKRPTSLSHIYQAAVWSERELQDMFNLKFCGLKDSRRLLLDYKLQKGVLLKTRQPSKQRLSKFSNYSDLYYS